MTRRSFLTGAGAATATGLIPWKGQAQSSNSPQLLGYLRTNWSRDPFSYGSYSHIAKGAWRRHHGHLARPIADKLYFAGEAANPDRNSSVHAAFETGHSVAAQLLDQSHQRIGIIGAGIAGLTAAHVLSTSGRDVELIEARNRLGGRINTDLSLGSAADLGASWLHWADGNPLVAEIDKAGMRRVVYLEGSSAILRDGAHIELSEAPDWFEDVLLFNNHAATGAGTLNFWAYMLNSEYSGKEYLFPDGYDQILANYAGDYSVSLQNVVTAINYGGDGVSVISTNGTSHFDAVIVTVPLGVLKASSIQFTPALPASHQNAIAKLGFGTLDKVYLQFDDVFWNRDTHSLATPFTGLPPGHFNAWLNLYPVVNKPILVCFNGGPAALELASQPDEVIVEMARSTIFQAYGLEP